MEKRKIWDIECPKEKKIKMVRCKEKSQKKLHNCN